MKKKIFILIFVTILILGLVIFFLKKDSKEIEIQPSINSSLCYQMQEPEMKTTCLAMFSQNPSLCSEAGNFDTYCYDIVFGSMKQITPNICEEFKKYPRDVCFLNLAKKTKDHRFCDDVTFSWKCFWELAKITHDASLCENIEVDCEKYQCEAEILKDINYCFKIPDAPEKDACIAKLKKDPAECSDYGEDVVSTLILASCPHSTASETGDISICDMIAYEKEKWSCLAELSESMDVCERAKVPFWMDFCRVEYVKNNIEEYVYLVEG